MKRDLRWLVNRLSVMSFGEVGFRISRSMQLQYGSLAHRYKWLQPAQSHARKATIDLFSEVPAFQPDESLTAAHSDQLALVMGNKLQLFSGAESHFVGAPINWHRDPTTGIESPRGFGPSIDYRDEQIVGDVKQVWELGRHQVLVPLCIDYLVQNDQAILDKLVEFLDSWLEQNPPGEGIHWCSSLEVSLRLISWSLVHSLLVAGGLESGLFGVVKDERAFANSVFAHAQFVMKNLSRHSSSNNHLIGELVGVWVSCNVFDLGSLGQRWAGQCQQELEHEVIVQNFSDGVNREQAIYYHLWVLEYFWLSWLIGQRYAQPFSDEFLKTITRMVVFLKSMCASNGAPPNIGDADGGLVARFSHRFAANPFADTLNSIDQCVIGLANQQSSDAMTIADDYFDKGFWYSRMLAGCDPVKHKAIAESLVTEPLPQEFPEGGYHLLGNSDLTICFKSSPLGFLTTAAHGHADALSLTIALSDQWWLTDQGTYTYRSADGWREYFRGTSAHNTISVDDENQSTMGGAFLWTHKAKCKLIQSDFGNNQIVEASHDGYAGKGVVHRRRVELDEQTQSSNQRIVVTDWLELEDKRSCRHFDSWFHFHPDVEVESHEGDIIVFARRGSTARLRVTLPFELEWQTVSASNSPKAGWYSERFGQLQPCITLTGRSELAQNTVLITAFEFLR